MFNFTSTLWGVLEQEWSWSLTRPDKQLASLIHSVKRELKLGLPEPPQQTLCESRVAESLAIDRIDSIENLEPR